MSIKILIVDDEVQFVELLAERLAARGFSVLTAFSGEEALAHIKNHEDVDVVILDVVMPGQTGHEVLKEIKNLRPLIEVIMLTGHGTVETAIEGMKLGAYDFLIKPTEITDLVAKINKAYTRKAEQMARIR